MSYLGTGVTNQVTSSPNLGGSITIDGDTTINSKIIADTFLIDFTKAVVDGKTSLTINLPKISDQLKINTFLFISINHARSNTKAPVKLIINCDASDKIDIASQSVPSTILEIPNFTNDHKFSLTHDKVNKWRNIVLTSVSTLGNGPININVPYGVDLLEFFSNAPSGSYRMDGGDIYNDTLGLPYSGYFYDVIVSAHEGVLYKSLIFLGNDGSILTGTITNGNWSGMVSTTVPIGTPIPYPGANPPAGYILLNGSTFDVTKFKSLAKLFTNGVLPDLRGEFIRGWDNGRKVDTNRTLLSNQAALAGSITTNIATQNVNAGTTLPTPIMDSITLNGYGFNDNINTIVVPVTPGDTRPRNLAFNYIVRAA